MQGYRTYIIAILIAAAGIAHVAGYLNDSLYQTILTVLGSGGIMTMRAAIAANKPLSK